MLPPQADAVVMVEHTAEAGPALEVYRPVGVGENVIQANEDMSAGQVLFPQGHRLRPADLGGLAAVGAIEVAVFQRPRVAIISTGDELITAHDRPRAGQIRDINSWTLWGLVQAAGGEPKMVGIIRDDLDSLKDAVRAAAAESDLLLISGGCSVGARDHAMAALAVLGAPGVLVHGLAIKPGKPTIIGFGGGLPYFGLPGHPVACAVVFEVMVRPVLQMLQGLPGGVEARLVPARLTRNLPSAPGREDFIRVRLVRRQEETWAEPILGKSGIISTVARADGLVRIPFESDGLYEGDQVSVRLFDQV
jgi:molybdopterin molybdotransferase